LNEWGFASEISKWWESEFPHRPEWRLRTARVEAVVPGSQQRSDLLIEGDSPVICGEIRLPDHPQSAPWSYDNLSDATNKALARGCRWAFTSDSKTILLIDTQKPGPLITRIVHQIELESFDRRQELDSEIVLRRIHEGWIRALNDLAPIISGLAAPKGMAPDELFVNAFRELLSAPVAAIREGLHHRRADDAAFQGSLIQWMVDDQGWSHDPEQWEREVDLAAKLTSYVFATRLLFYEALKRSQPSLSALDLPAGARAFVACATLRAAFEQARVVSGDYETLFSWDRVCDYALVEDRCVALWQRVLEHIHVFDVSRIDHDILGRLFERLIDPNERYEWGQHYTSSDIVDLMMSFALPDGRGKVLDPAVGGGTFLVRAYARKKWSNQEESHQERLADLYGVDVSGFAATIATVNLAIRSLDFAENYPRIAAKSFFRITPGEPFMTVPTSASYGIGMREDTSVSLSDIDVLVGNPPYIRLHKLGEDRQREAKAILGRDGSVRPPSALPALSNYHVYFWLHGARFLRPGGRIALLTSGEWLDSDYGAALQKWLLDNFCIECLIESGAEPWFTEARVGTVVTIARQCSDKVTRENNMTRFVMLRRPLQQFYQAQEGVAEHFRRVDQLRDKILELSDAGETDSMDWSVVRQSELLALGLEPTRVA
jgi:hypothetical protein